MGWKCFQTCKKHCQKIGPPLKRNHQESILHDWRAIVLCVSSLEKLQLNKLFLEIYGKFRLPNLKWIDPGSQQIFTENFALDLYIQPRYPPVKRTKNSSQRWQGTEWYMLKAWFGGLCGKEKRWIPKIIEIQHGPPLCSHHFHHFKCFLQLVHPRRFAPLKKVLILAAEKKTDFSYVVKFRLACRWSCL